MKTSDTKKYREAVKWIALNDEPSVMDLEDIQASISVLMLSDVFGVEEEKIAKSVLRIRKKELSDLMG